MKYIHVITTFKEDKRTVYGYYTDLNTADAVFQYLVEVEGRHAVLSTRRTNEVYDKTSSH